MMILCLFSLSGCVKQPITTHSMPSFDQDILQARYADLPSHSQAVLYDHWQVNGQHAWYYRVNTSDTLEMLARWYEDQMERLGWRQKIVIDPGEYVLIFEKPGKYCTMVISREGKKDRYKVVLYTGNY